MLRWIRSGSDELLAQPTPISRAGIAARACENREGHDLIDLAARNLDFHGRVKKSW